MSPRAGGLDQARQRVKDAMRDPLALAMALGLDGRQEGAAFLCRCLWHDERTPSCRVSLGEDGTVRVKCFGCNHGDDGFGLVARARGLDIKADFPAVLEAAAAIVGVQVDPNARRTGPKRSAAAPPIGPAKEKKPAPPLPMEKADALHAELMKRPALLERVMTSRRLTRETVERAKLGFDPKRNALTIPYFAGGKLVSIKYKMPQPPDPKTGVKPKDKYLREPDNARKVVYGLDDLDERAQVVVCEGELDCLVLQQMGVNAVSVPDGVGSAGQKGAELSWLDPIETYADIILMLDADDSGRDGTQKLAMRLPPRKLRIAEIDDELGKDPTDLARLGRLDAIERAIREAKRFEHPMILSARGALDELEASLSGERGARVLPTGICGLDKRIGGGMLYGELVVVYGNTGSGKSTWAGEINYLVSEMMRQWCLTVSIEMPSREWHGRLVRRHTGRAFADLAAREKQSVREWSDELSTIYLRGDEGVVLGELDLDKLIEAIEFARRRYDTRVVIVDHLQKLMRSTMDSDRGWEEVDAICGKLQTTAQRNDVLILLLSHTTPASSGRGKQDDNPMPTLYSGRGSKGISQNAAMVIGVWRDRKLSGAVGVAKIGCLKYRDPSGDENFWVELEFDRRSLTYTEKTDDEPPPPLFDRRVETAADVDDGPSREEF